MNRIVVLGAKPNAVLPPANAIYCANASFISRESEISKYPVRVVVASSLVLSKGLREKVKNHEVYKTKIDAVRDFDASRIVLFAAPGRVSAAVEVKDYILKSGRVPEIMEYSVLQRIDLIRKLTNASYPLISDRYSRQPLPIRIRDKLEIWRCAWNWRFGNARRDVRAKYRPSTGILALLVAIAEHGKDAEYILTGIGIQDRHIYQYGDRKVIMTKNKSKVLPKHTEADLMVLKHLRENWRISTTDDELALGRCQTKPA